WYANSNTPITAPTGIGPVILNTGAPGTYSFVATHNITGCSTTQTVSVIANTVTPTMTITSVSSGYSLTCSNPCLILGITAAPGPGPISYSWTNVTTSITVSPPTGTYTACMPGYYVAQYKDGN